MAEDAFTNVSAVDIRAAQRAAIMNPNTPGEETIFVTATNTSLAASPSGNTPGTALKMARPIHPALDTTMAEIGKIRSTLKAAAFRPSFTLFAAIKRMMSP